MREREIGYQLWWNCAVSGQHPAIAYFRSYVMTLIKNYGRTNSNAPVRENCQLRIFNLEYFDKYFSFHFPVIL